MELSFVLLEYHVPNVEDEIVFLVSILSMLTFRCRPYVMAALRGRYEGQDAEIYGFGESRSHVTLYPRPYKGTSAYVPKLHKVEVTSHKLYKSLRQKAKMGTLTLTQSENHLTIRSPAGVQFMVLPGEKTAPKPFVTSGLTYKTASTDGISTLFQSVLELPLKNTDDCIEVQLNAMVLTFARFPTLSDASSSCTFVVSTAEENLSKIQSRAKQEKQLVKSGPILCAKFAAQKTVSTMSLTDTSNCMLLKIMSYQ